MDRLGGTAAPMVEIGSGPGTDAARVGALGVDLSLAMAKRARQRAVPMTVGDAHRLPIAGGSVGVVRADRVLQHLEEPQVALEEMVRILRPGGHLVVADPDQQTLSITVPGVPDRITSTVRRLRRDVGYRNGRVAAETAGRLSAIGLVDLKVEASALVLTDPDLAFGLPGWVARWAEVAGFDRSDDRLWRARLAATKDAGFVYAVTYLVTCGRKPCT